MLLWTKRFYSDYSNVRKPREIPGKCYFFYHILADYEVRKKNEYNIEFS